MLMTGMFSQGLSNYFYKEKEKVLVDQGAKIASSYKELLKSESFGAVNLNQLVLDIQNLQTYLNSSIIIVDTTYNVKLTSQDITKKNIGESLNRDDFDPVMDGITVIKRGKIEGLYNEAKITVAYPVIVNDRVIAAIFMNSSLPEIEKTISDVRKIIIICIIISTCLALILAFISSTEISKPLKEMNEAAKKISSGNFEKRIPVRTKDEVGQLAQSLNYMAESLEKQEIKRNEFISNISHDIRSPLTSMKGFLQAMVDGTIPDEKKNHYTLIVLTETERLTKLANDILDLNKVEFLKTDLITTDFDINELLRITAIKFENDLMDKNINLFFNLGGKKDFENTNTLDLSNEDNLYDKIYVNADYEKIQRVVYNLIDNAIKFTPNDKKITISTEIIKDKAIIKIKDEGIGLNDESKKRVFERFYKADESRGEYKKGSGLGLSIVKEFIKVHNENITFKSKINEGTEFTFTLSITKFLS